MSVTFSLEQDGIGETSPGVVALVRLPVPLTGLDTLTKALQTLYGPGLIILTDAPQSDDWLVVAKPIEAPEGEN